jgi:hypothetical protein
MERLREGGNWPSNMIDVSEDIELQYWCDFFKITPEQLKTAIKAVHNCAADKVNEYLAEKQCSHN